MFIAFVAVGAWLLGSFAGVPRSRRWMVIALLWGFGVLMHLALPEGHALRLVIGSDARSLAALGIVVAAALGYGSLIARLRQPQPARVAAAIPGDAPGFSSEELERYARHVLLREIGGPGQQRLKAARVLVIGAGGLGAPALLYLAAAGVGTLGVIDDDTIDASNLQRQIIHTSDRIGLPKVQSALMAVKALNPFVDLRPYQRRLTADIAESLIADYDLVLDGSDNFDTRYLVNRSCAALGVPLISAAITQWEGQISLYDPRSGGPCYECVFPERPQAGMVPTCAEAGVAAPLPGIIGSMMAMEAVKKITGAGQGLRGRLMIHDALYGETRVIATKCRAGCAACGATG